MCIRDRGYTRIDIRQDSTTGKLYMLEANAQCGLSEDEDYTSIGAIPVSYTHLDVYKRQYLYRKRIVPLSPQILSTRYLVSRQVLAS